MFSSLCTLLFALRLVHAADPVRPYPLADSYLASTSILDHSAYVQDFDDPQWYLDNIPFVDFPDQSITDVYYYRTSVIKRHLKYVHEGHGWIFTEFIHPVSWASKFQTIPDSAPHQIVEGRWLRDLNYVKDTITTYTRGGVEILSGISYTHYIQDAILEHAQATGDRTFLISQLDGMIKTYNLWDVQLNNDTGLYHRTPLSDAQEYSLPGYLTGGPDGGPMQEWVDVDNDYSTIWLGPETYRPNFNAYMVANARAIAAVAQLAGNSSLAQEWSDRATTLYKNMRDLLFDEDLKFWIDVVEGTNLAVTGRELIGYFPYRFGVGTDDDAVRGLEAGLTPEAFLTEFGPTTLEQSNSYYDAFKNTTYCCMWNGQSWPFSTSVYLGTLARLARGNQSAVVTKDLFYQEFKKYALTNYKDGVPYTAESHYPTIDKWSGDTMNHSEHYLHSTYLDNVFTNLIGLIPTLDDRLELRPLIPDNWTYFAVENLPYHGSLLSILWDQSGTNYPTFNHSAGLSIYQNSQLIHNQPSLAAFNLTLANSSLAIQNLSNQTPYANILANPNSPWSLPSVTADYRFTPNGDTSPYEAWKLNDGLVWYDSTPDNRWTNNQSTTPFSTLTIRLPRPRPLSSLTLAIYTDALGPGAGTGCPAAINITTTTNTTTTLLATRPSFAAACSPNALNTILFDAAAAAAAQPDPLTTDNLQVVLTNQLGLGLAVSEIQLWVPASRGPRFEMEDALLGTFVGGFEGVASGMNASVEGGGVVFGEGAWGEVAGVVGGGGDGGSAAGSGGSITVSGGGTGTLAVQANYLGSANVSWTGVDAEKVVELDLLHGENVVTFFWVEGSPWVDAFVVG